MHVFQKSFVNIYQTKKYESSKSDVHVLVYGARTSVFEVLMRRMIVVNIFFLQYMNESSPSLLDEALPFNGWCALKSPISTEKW